MATQSSQDLKNTFIGTWKLVSAEAQQPNGAVIPYRYGAGSIGYIMYDATGHVAVQIMQPNRPQFASGDLDKGAPEEIKAAFEGYGRRDGAKTLLRILWGYTDSQAAAASSWRRTSRPSDHLAEGKINRQRKTLGAVAKFLHPPPA